MSMSMVYNVNGNQYRHRIRAKGVNEWPSDGVRPTAITHPYYNPFFLHDMLPLNFENRDVAVHRTTYCQRLKQAISGFFVYLVSLWNNLCPCTCLPKRNINTPESLVATPLRSSVQNLSHIPSSQEVPAEADAPNLSHIPSSQEVPAEADVQNLSHIPSSQEVPAKADVQNLSHIPSSQEVPAKAELDIEETEWSKQLTDESLYARNQRLNQCYIPRMDNTIAYLDAVRKNKGKYNLNIRNASVALNRNPEDNIKNSNYDHVMKNEAKIAYHEATLMHEIIMFGGVDALQSRSEECDDDNAQNKTTLLGVKFLNLLKSNTEEGLVNAYRCLEEIRSLKVYQPLGSESNHNLSSDVDIIMKRLQIPNYDIRGLVSMLLSDGRLNEFRECSVYYQFVLTYEKDIAPLNNSNENNPDNKTDENTQASSHSEKNPNLLEKMLSSTDKKEPLCTLSETEDGADNGTCIICCENYTHISPGPIKTLCCKEIICADCISHGIISTGKMGYTVWKSHNQMPACLSCKKGTPMHNYERYLSQPAKKLLEEFEQQYLQPLYQKHSTSILISCSEPLCNEQYLIQDNTKSYFQCDRVSCHPNKRILLHHIPCGLPWTLGHNAICPENKTIQLREEITSVQNMITNVDTIKQCPSVTMSNEKCTMMVYRTGGCNQIQCPICLLEYCWECEKEWSTHGGSFYNCSYKDKEEIKKKHLDKLEEELAKLKREYKRKTGKEYILNSHLPESITQAGIVPASNV